MPITSPDCAGNAYLTIDYNNRWHHTSCGTTWLEIFDSIIWYRSLEICSENWLSLGVALRYVKNVSLDTLDFTIMALTLQQLQSCESLVLPVTDGFELIELIVSRLPKLRTITIYPRYGHREAFERLCLDMVKSRDSITNIVIEIPDVMAVQNHSLQGEVDLFIRDEVIPFCLLNRVFRTDLICFGPTDLWTRILSKIDDEMSEQLSCIGCYMQSQNYLLVACSVLPGTPMELRSFRSKICAGDTLSSWELLHVL